MLVLIFREQMGIRDNTSDRRIQSGCAGVLLTYLFKKSLKTETEMIAATKSWYELIPIDYQCSASCSSVCFQSLLFAQTETSETKIKKKQTRTEDEERRQHFCLHIDRALLKTFPTLQNYNIVPMELVGLFMFQRRNECLHWSIS